jgi:hypothetical protein
MWDIKKLNTALSFPVLRVKDITGYLSFKQNYRIDFAP